MSTETTPKPVSRLKRVKDVKTLRVSARITPTEFAALERFLEEVPMTQAQVVRAALRDHIPPEFFAKKMSPAVLARARRAVRKARR